MYTRVAVGNQGWIYQSTLLSDAGVPHAFTTRRGPEHDHWDMAQVRHEAALHPHYQALLQSIGRSETPLVHVSQVHGRSVLVVDHDDIPAPHQPPQPADGLITAAGNLALTIRIADCVPILITAIVQGQPRVVSAVHAGWRGMVAGILPNAIRGMHQLLEEAQPAAPARIIAAIGPCISASHFEVGDEVAQAFEDAGLDAAIIRREGRKPHVDLPEAAKLELLAAGLQMQDIEPGTLCTWRQNDEFYSHRKEQGRAGRLAAIIALPHTPDSVE